MTIQVGTLCIFQNARTRPDYNGKICEVIGPACQGRDYAAVYFGWPIRFQDGRTTTDYGCKIVAARYQLIPISDPDADLTERRDDLVYA